MTQRILILLGHPSSDSFCAALARHYQDSARQAGHEVRTLHLGDLDFDPILRQGYRQPQPLEADLLDAQQAITRATRLVLVFPIWWGGIPALLKGFLDRILLPGFAFRYKPGSPFPEKLLAGRHAHLLVPMDTPPWYYRWVYAMPGLHQMRRTPLAFCGSRPEKTLTFGPLLSSTPRQRQAWLEQTHELALR